ncbi:MAG: phosphotransferase, partial [Pseudomonadota bacterium]
MGVSAAAPVRQRTLDVDDLSALLAYLRFAMKAEAVAIDSAQLLSGGAVQENWRVQLQVTGGTFDGPQDVVLRTDAQARVPISLDRSAEFRVLETAFAAGVAVAEPLLECRDATIIGAPFTLQRYCPGEASARSLTRSPDLDAWGDDAVFALGRELATVHTIRPGAPSAERLSFLPVPLHAPGVVEVERLRGALKGSAEARPAL